MRLRNITGSREVIADSEYVVHDFMEQKGKWHEVFGNDRPIHIEIGMGKGQFLTTLALKNPDINFIGIEKFSSVLLRASEKLEQIELNNVRIINYDAANLMNIFEMGEVESSASPTLFAHVFKILD